MLGLPPTAWLSTLSAVAVCAAWPGLAMSDTSNLRAPDMGGADIAGHWSFSARIQQECTFDGTARLRPRDRQTYSVELTARQSCTYLDQDFLVRQVYDATRLGTQLSIRCVIQEFLNGFESASYYPDNFSLTIASSDRMHGALVSAGSFQAAEWTRTSGGIS